MKKEKVNSKKDKKQVDISIDAFGSIVSNLDIDALNEFLDEELEDKKFQGVDVKRRTGNSQD